jgi:hypothetical protein
MIPIVDISILSDKAQQRGEGTVATYRQNKHSLQATRASLLTQFVPATKKIGD